MKRSKLASTIAESIIALLVLGNITSFADCWYIDTGGSCGGPNQALICEDSCVGINWSVNSYVYTCTGAGEGGCGWDDCKQAGITIFKCFSTAPEIQFNGHCLCDPSQITDYPWTDYGNCQQDYIPGTANECGPESCYE